MQMEWRKQRAKFPNTQVRSNRKTEKSSAGMFVRALRFTVSNPLKLEP